MKILITGHEGFVGRHFIKRLTKNKLNYVLGIDIKNGDDCRVFFKEDNTRKKYWDLVIHLAAIVGGRQTIEHDPISVATDLSIDSEMFNWAARKMPKRVIYFSSSSAYPVQYQTKGQERKLKEEDINLEFPMKPDFTYGWAKLTGELLANYTSKCYGVKISIFRPFSGYGEDQDLSYPFPSFIKRAKLRQSPFEIWGDGKQVRDFIYIEDIVDATLEAIKQEIDGAVNLGWGRPISFNELAKMVTDAEGYKPKFIHLKDKPSGVYYRVANNSKMLEYYRPKITLEEGINKALHFYK